MRIVDESCEKGVIERSFELEVDGDVVPGIHWLPEEPAPTHPTVLIGHGGTQHKRVPNVLRMGRKLVRHLGYGAVALDAPGHGDRISDEQRAAQRARIAQMRTGTATGNADRLRSLRSAAPRAVREWKALLDVLQKEPAWADGPFGYWGVSMGCAFGMPLLATEPRIQAAVLGLAGARDEQTLATAAQITQPLLFLFQADDELMTVDSGIELWKAFGAEEKAFHMNPGPHVGIPQFENEAARLFFRRHLEGIGGS